MAIENVEQSVLSALRVLLRSPKQCAMNLVELRFANPILWNYTNLEIIEVLESPKIKATLDKYFILTESYEKAKEDLIRGLND